MNYHDFKQQIISTLSDRLGSDVRITVSDILKNNDTHLDGLTILAPGQNLAPWMVRLAEKRFFKKYDAPAPVQRLPAVPGPDVV